MNTQAINDNQVFTNAYVDQFHQKTERSRKDAATDFYNVSSDLVKTKQDNNYIDNKLTNINSNTVNRDPGSDIELADEK